MEIKHIIKSKQFIDKAILDQIFSNANEYERLDKENAIPQILQGKVLASLFYEPSTRTRFSFEAAMLKLGGQVMSTESAGHFSSVSKGESLTDTIKIIGGYADVIIMRHSIVGSALTASKVSQVPLINAGDGIGEHPTQALLDLYTIHKEFGRISDVSVAMVGDLLYGRTVHSLITLLSKQPGITVYLVSPPQLRLPEKYKEILQEHNIEFEETYDLNKVLDKVDIFYMTRIQKERFDDKEAYDKLKGCFVVNKETMKQMSEGAIVMHPLPRVDEISPEIDSDPRAAYFRQAKNGLYLRMALLKLVLGNNS
jgi:aspartate carbamoyltransferase catalytic subunit